MIIDIHDYRAMPAEIANELLSYQDAFRQYDHIDYLLDNPQVRDLADKIHSWIKVQGIRAYHCTRAPKISYFARHGLRTLNRISHQREFITKYGENFTSEELAYMQEAWDGYFSGGQDASRAGQIWFCISKGLVRSPGTESFFKYFGGEAIYHALDKKTSAAKKLQTIGVPVVVEVSLPAQDIEYAAYPLYMAMLSHYHKSINPEARIYESEGFIKRDVLPGEIQRIVPEDEFA